MESHNPRAGEKIQHLGAVTRTKTTVPLGPKNAAVGLGSLAQTELHKLLAPRTLTVEPLSLCLETQGSRKAGLLEMTRLPAGASADSSGTTQYEKWRDRLVVFPDRLFHVGLLILGLYQIARAVLALGFRRFLVEQRPMVWVVLLLELGPLAQGGRSV